MLEFQTSLKQAIELKLSCKIVSARHAEKPAIAPGTRESFEGEQETMGKNPASGNSTGQRYRIAIMGPAGVGKSAIVNQFLYGKFHSDYKKTVEDMHRGEFDMDGAKLTLELLDTGENLDINIVLSDHWMK